MLERYAGLRLRKRKLPDGSFLELRDGHVARSERFRPDRSYVEGHSLPAVRAPKEGASCLQRLAALAA